MTNQSTQPAVMWWDGGERAITAREKALIEEHSPSSFAIPLIPAPTPGARWASDGQPDPHGRQYECERSALTLGHYTDDELANAVFLHGNEQPSMAALAAGKALPGIAYLTAAKDRIRWLSRSLSNVISSRQPVEEAPSNPLLAVARRNIRQFIEKASFASAMDRWSAGQCIDVMEAAIDASVAHTLSTIATGKLKELAAQGYVTNGVAIFNPATGQRGLVDNLGYVGWQGAQGIDLGQFRKAVEDYTFRTFQGSEDRAYGDRLLALIDGRDAGAGVGDG